MAIDTDAYRPYLDNGRQGFLYCLTHPAMPGLIKIGATRKHPLQRMKELGAGTGVPGQFMLAYYRDFVDSFVAETLTHEAFAECRVDEAREFFETDLDKVVDYVEGLARSTQYKELASQGLTGGECGISSTPFANLFATFPDDGSPRELTAEEQQQCRELRTYG